MSQQKQEQTPVVAEVAESSSKALDTGLKEAAQIFGMLQDDIQLHLIEEYIKPQLRGDDLVREFDKQLNSDECSSLNWQVLVDVVKKIIENEAALAQMCEKYENIGFKRYYEQHFIQNIMTFKNPDWSGKPLESFCATLTMCKWH